MINTFLLYGATGYTARLILRYARQFGLEPVLAGRNEAALRRLAEEQGLSYRVADLNDEKALDAALTDMPVVLHCAGPFVHTALPMQRACLRMGTHYLDITGEIAVFEQGKLLDETARQRGVMLLSGVGFDVVPTDCLARHLSDRLPDATHLELAFASIGGSVSHGTALTAAENMGGGGKIRRNGMLVTVPNAHRTLDVDFEGGKKLTCMAIPWGDVSTAWHTTGIPNIETFMAVPTAAVWAARAGNYLGGLLRNPLAKRFLQGQIRRRVTGPDERTRQTARSLVWGRVRNAAGQTAEARLSGPEVYTLTALAALTITQRVLNGEAQAGYQTPAGLFGADLVLEIEGVRRS